MQEKRIKSTLYLFFECFSFFNTLPLLFRFINCIFAHQTTSHFCQIDVLYSYWAARISFQFTGRTVGNVVFMFSKKQKPHTSQSLNHWSRSFFLMVSVACSWTHSFGLTKFNWSRKHQQDTTLQDSGLVPLTEENINPFKAKLRKKNNSFSYFA